MTIIGIIMFVLFFSGLIVLTIRDVGLWEALKMLAGTLFIVGYMLLATWLVVTGLDV